MCLQMAILIFLTTSVQTRAARIDVGTYERIRPGMTEREVIDLLGAPPGFHFRGVVFFHTIGAVEPAVHYYGTNENKAGFPLVFSHSTSKARTSNYVRKGW